MTIQTRFEVAGRKALVTGSTRGIGATLADALNQSGATVARHGQSTTHAEEKPFHYFADLASVEATSELAACVQRDLGQVDILVLNAAADFRQPWLDATSDDVDLQLAVNFRSTLLLCQLLLPPMMARGWGRVMTIGSIQETHPNPNYLVYAASKAAQTSLVRNLARQVGSIGVTINNIVPGAIATDRNATVLADPAYRARVESLIPLGRIGQVDDCVGACLLLASDAGAYINGASIAVDGGWSA